MCRNGNKQYASQCFCIPQKVIFNLRNQATFNLPNDNYVHEVKIVNYKKGAQIVETGGKGIGPYLTGGAALLVIGSIFFFVSQQNKKRRKAKRRALAARRKANGQTGNGRK